MKASGRVFPPWPITEPLARAVEERRKDLGLTQEGLAQRVRNEFHIKCTNEAISNVVTQKAGSSTLVEPLCEILGLNLLELVAMDDRQKKVLQALAAVAAQSPEAADEFVKEIETRSKWLAPASPQGSTAPGQPGPVRSRGSR